MFGGGLTLLGGLADFVFFVGLGLLGGTYFIFFFVSPTGGAYFVFVFVSRLSTRAADGIFSHGAMLLLLLTALPVCVLVLDFLLSNLTSHRCVVVLGLATGEMADRLQSACVCVCVCVCARARE